MANVTVSASYLVKLGWEIPESDQDKDLVISWNYEGKMRIGIVRGNEVDDVTSDYDLDFDQFEKDLPVMQEDNVLEDENYTL